MTGPRHNADAVRKSPRCALRTTAGLTLVEMLVVIAIIGVLVALLFPAVQAARESSRRSKCLSNLRQLGLGLASFQNTFGELPPASQIQTLNGRRVETWSWLVLLLPYLEQGQLYDSLEVQGGQPIYGLGVTPVVLASNTVMPQFRCPSYGGPAFEDEEYQVGALTNYKALGASHLGSLERAVPGQVGYPLYDPQGLHPDGVIFPGERGLRLSEIRDGASNTAVATETCEQEFALWIFGTQASLAGLPTWGPGAVRFSTNPAGHFQPVPIAGAPAGSADSFRTFLSYPYSTTDRYSPFAVRGPDSNHYYVVNHLLADGSTHGISRSIDPAPYMYLLTRSGNDPAGAGL